MKMKRDQRGVGGREGACKLQSSSTAGTCHSLARRGANSSNFMVRLTYLILTVATLPTHTAAIWTNPTSSHLHYCNSPLAAPPSSALEAPTVSAQ